MIEAFITGAQELTARDSIGAREVKFEITDWVDSVFDKKYNLPPPSGRLKTNLLPSKSHSMRYRGGTVDLPSGDEC